MTHTMVINAEGVMGDQHYIMATVTMTSYTASGEVLTDLLNMCSTIMRMDVVQVSSGATYVTASVNRATAVVRFWTTSSAELTTGYALTFDVLVFWR